MVITSTKQDTLERLQIAYGLLRAGGAPEAVVKEMREKHGKSVDTNKLYDMRKAIATNADVEFKLEEKKPISAKPKKRVALATGQRAFAPLRMPESPEAKLGPVTIEELNMLQRRLLYFRQTLVGWVLYEAGEMVPHGDP